MVIIATKPKPTEIDMLKFLVTGTPRSGTMYMSKLLTSLGVPCGHEQVFTASGIIEQDVVMVAESSWMAVPFLNNPFLYNATIIHVVRHPIQVISSIINSLYFFNRSYPKNEFETVAYKFTPDLIVNDNQVARACLFYVHWNEIVEPIAHFRYHVEDEVSDLMSFLKITNTKNDYFKDRKCNNMNKGHLSESAIMQIPADLKNKLFNLMDRYGYRMQKLI